MRNYRRCPPTAYKRRWKIFASGSLSNPRVLLVIDGKSQQDECVSENLKLLGIFMSADAPTYVHFPTLLVGMQDGEGKILEHKILRFRQKNPCSYCTIAMM